MSNIQWNRVATVNTKNRSYQMEEEEERRQLDESISNAHVMDVLREQNFPYIDVPSCDKTVILFGENAFLAHWDCGNVTFIRSPVNLLLLDDEEVDRAHIAICTAMSCGVSVIVSERDAYQIIKAAVSVGLTIKKRDGSGERRS